MAQVLGRLVYIEPNDLYAQQGLHLRSNDNLSWHPEDLGISVDLQVIIPNRDDCGQHGIDEYHIMNITANDNSIFKTWQSFMEGSKLNDDKNFLST